MLLLLSPSVVLSFGPDWGWSLRPLFFTLPTLFIASLYVLACTCFNLDVAVWSQLPSFALVSDEHAGKFADKDKGICDIHVIDVYLTSARSNTWVFDTGSVAHICNSQEELRNKRRLARDEVTMRVGNGSKVEVVAVGSLPLRLPSGMILVLNKCLKLVHNSTYFVILSEVFKIHKL